MLLGFASGKENTPSNSPSTTPNPDFDDDFLDEEDDSVGDEIAKTLVALMPWGISILFHVALIVIAFFLVWQTIIHAEEEQPVIPDSKLSQAPTAPMVVDTVEDQSSEASAIVPAVDPVVTDPTPVVAATPVPAVMVSQSFSGGSPGGPLGSGNGNGDFGTGVFGNGGNAKNIAFIVDASGSMVDVLPLVVNELKRVVNELDPKQKITIIMFSGSGIYEVPGGGGVRGLRACTPKFKEDIRTWVSLENFKFETGGRGSIHVEEAISRGLAYRPQLVFLLSDNLTGGGQGATQHEIFQDDLMKALREANKHRPPAKFNTLQFIYEDPLIRAGLKGTLQLIAEETGGNYKFIGNRDLNLK